ncbi:putative disease resistance protein At1g50180 [Magnolia sinica]|uniref:putative disease resistance protein At1g50180 n=1 Tax=Magnolia sinica TaxID=86752 RepID=UPI0026588255|nr:putative disease resistance protein At1g50180 [Magnolia sinica]
MAESAVNFLIQYLGPLLVNEVQSLKGVGREVRELINEFESIRSVLRDADARQDTDEGLKTWVKQIREVAYNIEDVLDEFMVGQAQEQQGARRCINFLHKLIKQPMVRHKTASSIRDIKTRVHSVKERKDAYSLDSMEQTSSSKKMSDQWYDPRLKALFIEEVDLVGIDVPRRQLIEWLVDKDSRLLTISVVGIGGIGKTTLVKKVYDNQQVKKCFETYAWITVSQSFKAEELLRSMVKQFFEEKKDPSPQAVWNFIRNALPNNEYGSRVIITTRKGDVASSSCIGPSDLIYNLKPLHATEAWSLFCKKRNGQKVEDIRVIEKALRSLTTKFEHVVVVIEESKDLDKLFIEELGGLLQVHEQRMQKNAGSTLEHALESKLTLKEQKNDHTQRGGHGTSNRARGNSRPIFDEFKKAIFKEFEMTDEGLISFFLGIEVKQQHGSIYISQKKKNGQRFCTQDDWILESGSDLSYTNLRIGESDPPQDIRKRKKETGTEYSADFARR